MKTFLLLPPSNYAATLLEAMTTAMAGGYGGWRSGSIQPVLVSFLDDKDISVKHMVQICADYEAARSTLQSLAPSIPLLYMDAPMQIHQIDFANALGCDDRVVVFCQLRSGRCDLQLALQTYLAIAQSNHDNTLIVVCELTEYVMTHKTVYDHVRHSLDFLRNMTSVVFTGLRDDSSKKGFTFIQTAVALLDAMIFDVAGFPHPLEKRCGLAYTQKNLQSIVSIQSLTRMMWLMIVTERSNCDDLSKWRDRLHFESNDVQKIWAKDFPELLRLGQSMHHWLSDVPSEDFVLTKDDRIWQNILHELDSTRRLPKDFTLKAQRETAISSLLSAINVSCPLKNFLAEGHYDAVIEDFLPIEINTFSYDAFTDDLSPTIAYEVASMAFRPNLSSNAYALCIRSTILDLWEMFFLGYDKSQNIRVKERFIVPKSKEAICLSLNQTGKRQLAAKLIYEITWENEMAWSSVDVGFALMPSSYERIASSGKELSERNKSFQNFLYAYVRLYNDVFCSDFKYYVEEQTVVARKGTPAEDLNIISRNPRYRHHIGLYWT